MRDESVYDFWNGQVKKHRHDIKAVNFDLLEEELELLHLGNLINDNEVVCDLGCGNGRTIIELSKKNPRSIFYGFDFVKGMIDVANEQKQKEGLSNVHFNVFDASTEKLEPAFLSMFDKVITKRLLINLKGNSKQNAIDNIHSILKDDGVYIMVECFIEPLKKINAIRESLNLCEINVHSFNEYLTHGFLNEIEEQFSVKQQIDFESLYYFISRVFNAYLSEGEPDYFAPINKLAVKLSHAESPLLEGYSPEKIILLEKAIR